MLRKDKEDFLLFLGRADEEKAPHLAIQAARRAGRRLVLCVTTKNQREQLLGRAGRAAAVGGGRGQGRVRPGAEGRPAGQAAALLFPIQWPEPFGLVMTEAMAAGHQCWPGATARFRRWSPTARPASSSPRSRRWPPPSIASATWTHESCEPGSRSSSQPTPWWPAMRTSHQVLAHDDGHAGQVQRLKDWRPGEHRAAKR